VGFSHKRLLYSINSFKQDASRAADFPSEAETQGDPGRDRLSGVSQVIKLRGRGHFLVGFSSN